MQETHELQEEKSVVTHAKAKALMEKTHQKSFKRGKNAPKEVEEIKNKNSQEMTVFIGQHQHQVHTQPFIFSRTYFVIHLCFCCITTAKTYSGCTFTINPEEDPGIFHPGGHNCSRP